MRARRAPRTAEEPPALTAQNVRRSDFDAVNPLVGV